MQAKRLYPGITGMVPDIWGSAAIIITETGRYLMQRRDDIPSINYPDHWGCFGGGVEPGEEAEGALRRELEEEIGLINAGPIEFFTEIRPLVRFAMPRIHQISYFIVNISEATAANLFVKEGAGSELFRADDLAGQRNVVPWDLAAVLSHARRGILFGTA